MAGGECSVAGTGKTAPRCPHKPGGGRWTDRSTETKSLKDSEQRDKVARQLPGSLAVSAQRDQLRPGQTVCLLKRPFRARRRRTGQRLTHPGNDMRSHGRTSRSSGVWAVGGHPCGHRAAAWELAFVGGPSGAGPEGHARPALRRCCWSVRSGSCQGTFNSPGSPRTSCLASCSGSPAQNPLQAPGLGSSLPLASVH